MYGVWNFGVWDFEFGVLDMGFGVRLLGFGILELGIQVCDFILGFRIWCLEFGIL